MIAVAKSITSGDTYGLVFNQTEPFWLAPWLGGFGGAVFAEDGVTPTLNTPEMVATLQFLYDLKYTDAIMPAESDYNGADTLFKEGKAGMLINGDWSLADYKTVLGDKLGVAPLPKVTATGLMPAPYTSGTYFMIPKEVAPEKMDYIKAFVEFATNLENQTTMVTTLSRLPGLVEALSIPEISDDPILQGSAAQMSFGTPMPTVLEMRCNWDAMKPEQIKVLADQETPEDAAAAMQAAADACIVSLE
jgi:arabinogalactan oligomer/maltooligosaccharide transport system substrate-binding protein